MRRIHRSLLRRHRPAALLIALAVGTQLGGSFHYVLVEHVQCAEHGEIAHGVHLHAVEPRAEQGAVDAIAVASSDAPDSTHEHCPLAVEPRGATVVTPGTAARLVPPEAESPRDPGAEARAPRIALYLLAPKSSPPA